MCLCLLCVVVEEPHLRLDMASCYDRRGHLHGGNMETKKGEEARHESRFRAKEGISRMELGKRKRTRGGCQQLYGNCSKESRQSEEG